MKRIFIIIILILSLKLGAQINLVPNPSFENYSTCPNAYGQIFLATSWSNPSSTASPDYFNTCGFSPASVPGNPFGYQYAHIGNAYTFVGVYNINNGNYREYIQALLTYSLKAGKEYCVEFYVSSPNEYKYATDGIAAYLSDTAVSTTSFVVLPFIPQISNSSGNIITDTMNWTKVSGSFIATGGEKYILIGNFKNDITTNTSIVNNSGVVPNNGGFYIDDVSVICCNCDTTNNVSSIIIPNIFTPNNDNLNDVFSITSKNIKTLNCKIYNRWGLQVGELKTENDVWEGITTAGLQCTDGVYYYVLSAEGEDGKEYNEKGFVQLIR